MNEAIVGGAIAGAVAGVIAAVLVILSHEGWPGRRGARIYSFRAPSGTIRREQQFRGYDRAGLGPFDRFNDRAKRVLALAQDEAIRLNQQLHRHGASAPRPGA